MKDKQQSNPPPRPKQRLLYLHTRLGDLVVMTHLQHLQGELARRVRGDAWADLSEVCVRGGLSGVCMRAGFRGVCVCVCARHVLV